MGVVLGRSSETRVADAVPALAELPGADDLVYLGGPVSPQSVVALGEFGHPEEAGTQVVGSLGTLDPDGANDSLRPGSRLRGLRRLGPGPARRRARGGGLDRPRGRPVGPVPPRRYLVGCARAQGRSLSPDGDHAGGSLAELGGRGRAHRQAAGDRRPVRIEAARSGLARPAADVMPQVGESAQHAHAGEDLEVGRVRRPALRSCRRRSGHPRGRAAPAARRCPGARVRRRRARSARAAGSPA